MRVTLPTCGGMLVECNFLRREPKPLIDYYSRAWRRAEKDGDAKLAQVLFQHYYNNFER